MTPNNIPALIADALNSPFMRTGRPHVVCIPFAVDSGVVRHLSSRPEISALIVSIRGQETSVEDAMKPITPFSPVEKPDPAIWRNASSLLFIGFTSSIPYGMLTSALRGGVKRVASLNRGSWRLQPTWKLLAERHMRAGLIYGPYRMGVHKLDQYGARLPLARGLAKALNGGRNIAGFVSSLPSQSNPAQSQGLAFYTGSLGSGGAERQMVNTIIALKELGIGPIRVACAGDANGFYRPVLDAAGIPVESVGSDPTGSNDHLAALSVEKLRRASDLPREVLMEAVALSAWLEKAPPQILHCWQDHCNVIGGLAGLLSGIPKIVLSTRSVAPYNFGFFQLNQRPAYRAFASRPEITILNNSSTGADDYSNWVGIDRKLINVIRNGVDLGKLEKPGQAATAAFRASLGIPTDAPVMGTIFTIYKFKRPLLWVDTAAAIAKMRPEAHFLIIGDGPMRQETETRIAQHGLTDRFRLPGRMEDVALALSAMQAFLLTSIHEGLPNVLLEAQMMGVPAVTVNVGGAAEAIDDGKTGAVVAEATPDRLAEAILAMFGSDQQNRSARLGPNFVSERFGIDRMIAETLLIYGLDRATATAPRNDL